MDNKLCDAISAALLGEVTEITFEMRGDNLFANLDCYAISSASLRKLAKVKTPHGMVLSIQSITNPKLQIIL